MDLVYFKIQVPDTIDTSDTNATRMRLKCDTSATRTTRELHERRKCDTSEKKLILITTHFEPLIFTIWQVKDYNKRSNFILSTTLL